jgi:hypothetical protein
LREYDLYPPVRRWLLDRGYEIHVEMFDADIVAVKDGKVTTIDLKLGFTEVLVKQLYRRMEWADYVFGAVPASCRLKLKRDFWFGQFRQHGFGLLLVDGDRVRQKRMSRPQPWAWHKRHNYRLTVLLNRSPAMEHELAGLPSCPQLRQQRLDRASGRAS